MIYLLDGYNLLFSLFEEESSLESQRKKLITFLQESLNTTNLSVIVIFDAPKRLNSSSEYFPNLEITYSPEGVSADEYIIEILTASTTPTQITVVTSDKFLKKTCLAFNSYVITPKQFIKKLKQKKKNEYEKKEVIQTDREFQRLLTIFENRLKKGED